MLGQVQWGGRGGISGEKSIAYALELIAAILATITFAITEKDGISVHLQMYNMAALSYLLKMKEGEDKESTVSLYKQGYLGVPFCNAGSRLLPNISGAQ